MAAVPSIALNNGLTIPAFGLGTWQAKPGEVEAAVKLAIDLGYRHIDCAMVYQNEHEIGNAIREKIAEGSIKREDLFITSKLWNTYHKQSSVVPACKKSLKNFGLSYLDLYLVHWPFAFQENEEFFARDADGKVLVSDDDYVDTWKGMEECVRLGLTKSIGVSNFNTEQLTRLLASATIKPVNNQIECHPYLNQRKLVAWCKERGITLTAYSPLGSPTRPWAQPGDPLLLDDPRIQAIANKVKKSPGQVVLNYLVKSVGVIPIPKSTNAQRLKDNISVFDFSLSPEDIATLDSMHCNGRVCNFNDARDHKDYPFNIEY